MTERIQKILSARGITSRRRAEELLQAGRVTVNGEVALMGQKADPDVDEICLDGKPISAGHAPVYIMLHKPRGFVTTMSDERGRRTVVDLVADCGVRVYPVGRLDLSSEGLLLMTNDGGFAQKMMHPSHQVEKTYLAWVTGFSNAALERMGKPMTLDGYTLQVPGLRLLGHQGDSAQLEITIHEGRNRQVRQMCALAGMHVNRLRRMAEGGLELGDLPVGKWRYLTDNEVEMLKKQGENHEKL